MDKEYIESLPRERADIYIGIVSRIVINKIDEIMPNGHVLLRTNKRNTVALDLRKIIFTPEGLKGRDLFYSYNGNSYSYNLCDLSQAEYRVPENNEIVIRNFRCADDLLEHFGVNVKLEKITDFMKVRSILLSNSKTIEVPKHIITLDEDGVINPNTVELVNDQANDLYQFVSLDLPGTPQKLEKVMCKYLSL